jgi:lipid A disaccharide synthetase
MACGMGIVGVDGKEFAQLNAERATEIADIAIMGIAF